MDIRPALESDYPGIVAFFSRNNFALQRADWFEWKHRDNPCGSSFILLAEERGRILATLSVIPQWFECRGNRYTRLQLSDALVDPDWRGKHLSTRLLDIMLQEWAAGRWGPSFFLGFPGPVQTRMASAHLGMKVLTASSAWSYVLGPPRFGEGTGRGRIASWLLSVPICVVRSGVLGQAGRSLEVRPLVSEELDLDPFRPRDRISGTRSAGFMRWRVTGNPVRRREVLGVFAGEELLGYCVGAGVGNSWEIIESRYRERPREALAAVLRFLGEARRVESATVCAFEPGVVRELPHFAVPRGRGAAQVYVHGVEEVGLPLDPGAWAVGLVDSDW